MSKKQTDQNLPRTADMDEWAIQEAVRALRAASTTERQMARNGEFGGTYREAMRRIDGEG